LLADGTVAPGSISFHVMKYHEEVNVNMSRVWTALDDADCVIECEQGVDMFVEPMSEWLQDNYEDFAVHNVCLAWAEKYGKPALLVETNADLDLKRGIDAEELAREVYQGKLQRNAFTMKVTWGDCYTPRCSRDRDGQSTIEKALERYIDIPIALGLKPGKKAGFMKFFGFDANEYAKLPSLYAAYVAYAATVSDATIPVAGLLEVMYALQRMPEHKFPFSMDAIPPPPQWILGRFLQPAEVPNGQVRVVSQFRAAGLDTAPGFAEFLGRWMFARNCRRQRTVKVEATEVARIIEPFWMQLKAARQVADDVKKECPDFHLWPDGGASFFIGALNQVESLMKTSEKLAKERERSQSNAKKMQDGYTELSPLYFWLKVNCIHIVDFTCRMLESGKGIEMEYEEIAASLPKCPEFKGRWTMQHEAADALRAAFISEWHNREVRLCVIS